MLGIGAGYSFTFGRSYPADREPVDRGTVLGAIASCHLALQLLGRRVPGDTPLNDWTATADFGSAEAHVEGPRGREMARLRTRERHHPAEDGRSCLRRTGFRHSRPSLGAVAWLARRLDEGGGAIEAGDIVATGSCTGLVQMTPGTVAMGDFGDLGTIELQLV